jgi:hypothetical protein
MIRADISCAVYAFPSMSIDQLDRAIGIGDGLALGHLTGEHLAGLRERDDRRGGARPLGVGDHDGLARLQHGDDRVGCSEVDADGLGHGSCPPGSVVRGYFDLEGTPA